VPDDLKRDRILKNLYGLLYTGLGRTTWNLLFFWNLLKKLSHAIVRLYEKYKAVRYYDNLLVTLYLANGQYWHCQPWTNVDTKAKCRHLKKLTCKGTLRQVFIRVYILEWRYSQSCWYFQPSFVNCCPSKLRSGSTLPPTSSLPCVKVQFMQTVCGWEGVEGVEL
jgi:hypothetical protein